MGRWARKTDDNHQEIMDAFRAHGFSVADTSRLGNGFPDLVVAKYKVNILIETKDGKKPPSARKLTSDEKDFHDDWKGMLHIIESVEAVERLNKEMDGMFLKETIGKIREHNMKRKTDVQG